MSISLSGRRPENLLGLKSRWSAATKLMLGVKGLGKVLMPLPAKMTVHRIVRWRDGGSDLVFCSDKQGALHHIELHQRMFLRPIQAGQRTPGRLYFDRHLLELRSIDESN